MLYEISYFTCMNISGIKWNKGSFKCSQLNGFYIGQTFSISQHISPRCCIITSFANDIISTWRYSYCHFLSILDTHPKPTHISFTHYLFHFVMWFGADSGKQIMSIISWIIVTPHLLVLVQDTPLQDHSLLSRCGTCGAIELDQSSWQIHPSRLLIKSKHHSFK